MPRVAPAGTGGSDPVLERSQSLQRPPTPLTADDADRIVRKALTSAHTQAGGRLSPDRSGCLVLVGFHLHHLDAEVLEDAAARLLAGRERGHLIAIVVMGLGVLVEETDTSPESQQRSLAATCGQPQLRGWSSLGG